jgi:ribose transport system permease protein
MNTLKSIYKNTTFPVVVIFIIFTIIISILSPGSINSNFIQVFFPSNFGFICIAIATGLIIMGGGIDISLGALLSLINVILTQLVAQGWDIGWAVLISLVIATACGALNGCIIGFLRISPMLATFATLSVFTGLALWVMPMPGGSMPDAFRSVFSGLFMGIPVTLLFLIGVLLLTFLIYKSPLGTKIKAVGWDLQKSFISGIKVSKVQFFIYTFAGLICGIGAIGLTANMGGGDPNVGAALSMTAIAACVIGGISLSGGVGNTLGAFFGALFLAMLTNLVLAANISSFYQDLSKGIILLLGIIVAVMLARKSTIAQVSNL